MRRCSTWWLLALLVVWTVGCPWDDDDTGSSAGHDGGATPQAGHGGDGGSGHGGDAGSAHRDGGPQPLDGSASGGDAGPGCKRGGCSSELCVAATAEDPISDCVFRPEYACYQAAACEQQAGGGCGFTQTDALLKCLADVAADGGGTTSGLKWYQTCGDPVCHEPPVDDPSLANCTTEAAGSACGTKDQQCDLVSCGATLLCTDKDPQGGIGGCPISRARFKQDIHYLDDSERERIYRDLLTIPLASYEYKNDPAAVPQLGFILEDVEPSPATRGDRVNLYGYLSMAVNAVQQQAKQIEALQREVAELRSQATSSAACAP